MRLAWVVCRPPHPHLRHRLRHRQEMKIRSIVAWQ